MASASLTGFTFAKYSGASMRSSSAPSTWRASGYCFTFLGRVAHGLVDKAEFVPLQPSKCKIQVFKP